MNKRALFFVGGISLAAAVLIGWRAAANAGRRVRTLRSADLYYSHLSESDIESNHLIDLNAADDTQLSTLELNDDSLQRLLDNRPYRSKLELISRMILTEDTYARIKDKIGVARGDEPVKTA